jgi:hypothetical protein
MRLRAENRIRVVIAEDSVLLHEGSSALLGEWNWQLPRHLRWLDAAERRDSV